MTRPKPDPLTLSIALAHLFWARCFLLGEPEGTRTMMVLSTLALGLLGVRRRLDRIEAAVAARPVPLVALPAREPSRN